MKNNVDIVCTIGNKSKEINVLHQMALSGMTMMRVNTTYCQHEDLKEFVNLRDEVSKKTGKIIRILADVRGMQLNVPEGVLRRTFKLGEKIIIGTKKVEKSGLVIINYDNLFRDLKVGTIIKAYEGNIVFEVIEIYDTYCIVEVKKGGDIFEPTGFNVPGVYLHNEILSEYDTEMIKAVSSLGYDIINVGVTKDKSEIESVKNVSNGYNKNIKIFCKIETPFGVSNIDEILSNCDGIMLARKDLSVEYDNFEVPYLQKMLISKSIEYNKECIVASQLLTSMINSNVPSVADISDITLALNQGSSAIMLSIESGGGNFPVECVRVMQSVIDRYHQQ